MAQSPRAHRLARVTYVALITGASSGIGEALARRLAREPGVALILVARREDRLAAIAAELGCPVSWVAADLTGADAPARVLAAVEREHGALHLLVNNAGARWAAPFADGGYANVAQHMEVNFSAPVRLVEALLPLMRRTAAGGPLTAGSAEGGQRPTFGGRPLQAPVAIVNVTSTAARISRRGTGGYSAAKAALAAWSDSLALEQAPYGVHVANVLPGFIATEGFPQKELRERPWTRWAVSGPQIVAEAVIDAGPGGAAERYVPRYYWLAPLLRLLAPALIRRGAASSVVSTATRDR